MTKTFPYRLSPEPLSPHQVTTLLEGARLQLPDADEEVLRTILSFVEASRANHRLVELALAGLIVLAPDETGEVRYYLPPDPDKEQVEFDENGVVHRVTLLD